MADPLLEAIENLSRFHREHEKFYAQRPREQAVDLQRHARALGALADRWSTVSVEDRNALNPYEGSNDLNSPEATQLDGVLFMEGEGEPVEVTRTKRDLRTIGADSIETGTWLAAAMEATWDAATDLLDQVDFTPASVRADLSGTRSVVGYLYSAVELIDRAADLLSDSAGLVHDNERRWRGFRARVEALLRSQP